MAQIARQQKKRISNASTASASSSSSNSSSRANVNSTSSSSSSHTVWIRFCAYVALVGWTVFISSPTFTVNTNHPPSQWLLAAATIRGEEEEGSVMEEQDKTKTKPTSHSNVKHSAVSHLGDFFDFTSNADANADNDDDADDADNDDDKLAAGHNKEEKDDGGSSTTLLPDWRLAVDCSAFDYHCATVRQSQGLYSAYPFPYGRAEAASSHEHFLFETLEEIPSEWKKHLTVQQSLEEPPRRPVEYSYPPHVSDKEYQTCLATAYNDSWQDQLEHLLQEDRIQPDPDTNMVAFTISDYNYAFDMMHDFFQMNDRIVGFPNAMFMVAIDQETVQLACQYHYPMLAWPSIHFANSTEDLKAAVANTKYEVSYALVERDISFFFYEMDVWFLQSPKPILQQFTGDILFSSHQNCPKCINIGVYSVVANKKTVNYFKTCMELAKVSNNTHDQRLMAGVIHMGANPKGFTYGKEWDPVPDYVPRIVNPVRHGFFNPHEIVADERPIPSQMTVAIHPLRSQPLKSPHGKKILAKEIGAWYGWEGPKAQAGYYRRTGSYRRYLWMDGHILNGFSNVMNWEFDGSESGLYHDVDSLKWTMAALMALARRTGRIFILPRILQDRGVHFLWTLLDMESVEELGIDVRETSFPNNPKAWYSDSIPFRTVARTAMGSFLHDKTMFAQYPKNNSSNTNHNDVVTRAWKFAHALSNTTKSMNQDSAIDSWWAIHTAIPEIDNAELLLVNPHFINMHYHRPLHKRMRTRRGRRPTTTTASYDDSEDDYEGGVAEYEIASVFYRLRWCTKDKYASDRVVGVFKADDDCYGRGIGS